MIRNPKKNNIAVILARKGSGKSVLMQYLLLNNPKSSIIIDPTGSLGAFKNRLFFDTEADFINAMKNGLFEKFKKNKVDCIIDSPRDLEAFLGYLNRIKLSNFQLVIDEIDLFYNAQLSQQSNLYYFINLGRHREVDILGVARRPANMPRPLTSQSDDIYIGHMNQEPIDQKYIKEFVSADFSNIEKYEFLHYNAEESFDYIRLNERSLKLLKI